MILLIFNVIFLMVNIHIFIQQRRFRILAGIPMNILHQRSSTISVLDRLINSNEEQQKLDLLTSSQIVQLQRVLDKAVEKKGIYAPRF